MVWIIIVVVFVLAFGPILWLRPDARQRRLAALRQRAYGRGLRVELRRLPGADVAPEQRVTAGGRALDTRRECAAYIMPLGARLRRLPSWRVLRGGDGAIAVPGWQFELGKRPEHRDLGRLLGAVAPVLGELRDDVVAVEADASSVAGYWLEGPGTTPEMVDDLAEKLAALGQALRALELRLEQESEPGNI